ncbi:hypothetical protein [Streptomyces sp. NPDC055060]
MTTSLQLGQAMLQAARGGAPHRVPATSDINELAASVRTAP